jgi:pimeloyl-ACP methyl ester carboxylesterase
MSAHEEISRRELLAAAIGVVVLACTPMRARADQEAIIPFIYRASDEALADLRRRLEQTRWPESETGVRWEQGPPLAKLKDLVAYWRTDYNWRRCEAELNRWPQYKTTIDGLGIHFIHVRSRHTNALPIILTHGWPSTILLFRDVIGPLTDPTAHGGTAADAFHVVIPSLPGFAFSDKPTARGWNAARTARAWSVLMRRLKYTRYVAQGGDWGAFVTTAMAQQQPASLAAIHLNFAQTMPFAYLEEIDRPGRAAVVALPKQPPRKMISAIMGRISEAVVAGGWRGCPFLNAAAEYPDPASPVRQAINARRVWYHDSLRNLLAEDGDPSPSVTASLLVALSDGLLESAYLDDPESIPALVREAVARLLDRR